MLPFVPVIGVWLAQAPVQPSERPAEVPLAVGAMTPDAPAATPASPPASASGDFFGAGTTAPADKPASASGDFFGAGTTAPPSKPAPDFFGAGTAPPPAAIEGPGSAPLMPPVEQLPQRPGAPSTGPKIVLGGAKDRKPIAGGGAGFFDPGKLADESTGGGAIQIRGYLGFNFAVTERTNTAMRNPATGTFDQLKTLPYFGGGAANLYVGAPVYSDVVFVRIAFEFISIPRATAGAADVSPAFNPVILMEAAALEVNPFAWASKAPRWFSEGFKASGGVFVVPFGLEDEEHDAPVRWWATRPLAMSAGRIYPGTWIDIGATVKWKPTFGHGKRPLEIDIGVLNGDACTQTRANDQLYRYQPVGQYVETCERRLRGVENIPRADGSVLGISPDNNGNKSFVARAMIRPVPALNLGGSFVWGKHPESNFKIPSYQGKTFVDGAQAVTWRAGAHFDLNFDEVFQSRFPLPHIRGEVVYGVDAAAKQDPVNPVLADRHMLGGYAQVAQPLWRRKKTRLPGLIVQYRFDHADPDLDVPRATPGGPVASDFSDEFRYDEALQAHVVGLRFPVLPRFTLKAEYAFVREDGGRGNRLHNDNFTFQAVADF